jgi:Zn-dependent M16 (insulinase) family peptidase
MLTFQKLDKVLEPSLKGLLSFSRGYTDEHRMKLRLRALDITREDLVAVADRYLMKAIENGHTSRVVFGSQQAPFEDLQQQGWSVYNPIDFLSYKYFDQWNQETAAAQTQF